MVGRVVTFLTALVTSLVALLRRRKWIAAAFRWAMSTRTYIDKPVGVAVFAPTDPEAPRVLRFVLYPPHEDVSGYTILGFCKVGEDKELAFLRGQVVTIALEDRPELCVTFAPWDNTRQSETLELGPSSSHLLRSAVISQPGVLQRELRLFFTATADALPVS